MRPHARPRPRPQDASLAVLQSTTTLTGDSLFDHLSPFPIAPLQKNMDTDAHTVNTGGIVGATPIHPKPHAIFWFADGDVVLATDKLLFRVHKRVLSQLSSVFKDIFEGSGSQDAVIAPEPYEVHS